MSRGEAAWSTAKTEPAGAHPPAASHYASHLHRAHVVSPLLCFFLMIGLCIRCCPMPSRAVLCCPVPSRAVKCRFVYTHTHAHAHVHWDVQVLTQPQARPGALLGCLSRFSALLVPDLLLGYRPTAPLTSGGLLGQHTQPTALFKAIDFWGFAGPAHMHKGQKYAEMYFFSTIVTTPGHEPQPNHHMSPLDRIPCSSPPQQTTQPAFFNLSLRKTR